MSMLNLGAEIVGSGAIMPKSVKLPVADTPPVQHTPADKSTQQVPVEEPQLYVLQDHHVEASFVYDQQLKQIVITLSQEGTGEVVRQIPQEHIRRFLVGMMDLADQILDAKA